MTHIVKYDQGITLLRCLLYLVAFADAELVTAHIDEVWGVVFYSTILFGLILHSGIVEEKTLQRLLMTLGLIPLIRITGLAIPVEQISQIYWHIIITVPVMTGVYGLMRYLGYSWRDVGFKWGVVPIQLLVAVAGIGIGAIDYLILEPESLIDELTFQEFILPAIILLLATGFVEELAFRGMIQGVAQSVRSWGWVYVAMIYAVLQVGQGSAVHCLFVFAVALAYGWIVKRTRSIVGVSVSHGLLNIGLYLVFPEIL